MTTLNYLLVGALSLTFLPACGGTQKESICFGTTSRGRLMHGWKLPSSGDNFVSYSPIGGALGRTYVHSKVYRTILDAYSELNKSHPDKVFKYAETGFEEGGRFKPHKTHQNGLSVDFMVPVVNADGESEVLTTWAFNKWGYNIEFDQKGRLDELTIDFEMVAEHILALRRAAKKHGLKISRVIFDPKLRPQLWKTKAGRKLRGKVRFMNRRAWVRHDEHYHVDFSVRCRKL